MRAVDCSPGMLAAINCAHLMQNKQRRRWLLRVRLGRPLGGSPGEWLRTKAAAYSDELSLKEAMNSINRDKWLGTMPDELASLIENGFYELVSLQVGAAALSWKWVPKIKRGAHGEIERFKARYVVRGFEQYLGKDFHETWAPMGVC